MLPKVIDAGFREMDIQDCPVIVVAGLECISVWRVAEALGMSRLDALRWIGERTHRSGPPGTPPDAADATLFTKGD